MSRLPAAVPLPAATNSPPAAASIFASLGRRLAGLANPTAVMVATGVGTSQGILIIKGGQALESAQKVDCIVFDKTGTLTIGKPVVVNTRVLKNMVLREFYDYVAAAEDNSKHPLTKAIVEHAKKLHSEENHVWPEARDFISLPRHGVKAKVSDKSVIVGNKSFVLPSVIDITMEALEILAEEEEKAQNKLRKMVVDQVDILCFQLMHTRDCSQVQRLASIYQLKSGCQGSGKKRRQALRIGCR